jgi:hypothetical protein
MLTPFEIDFPILMFVTAADMSRRYPTVVVATTALLLRLKKALFRAPLRNRIESRQRFEPLSRREWAKFF